MSFVNSRILILLAWNCAACSSAPVHRISDHYNGSTFHNTVDTDHVGLWAGIRHVAFGRNSDWPDEIRPASARTITPVPPKHIRVTFVNHATLLLEFNGVAILTDPVWSTRVGHFSWAGPKRATEPGIPFERLPRITAVVVSHNHFDHLDLPTLRRLKAAFDPLFFVPLGVAALIQGEVSAKVKELDWWDLHREEKFAVVLTPARHNSRRGLFDRDKTLWASYAIFANAKDYIYFAGDTAYGDHFKTIRQRLGAPKVALLPIGAYEPNEKMRHAHVNPAEAVEAHRDLGSPRSIAMHFGTFNLTAEAIDAPPRDLAAALENARIPYEKFEALLEGDYRDIALSAGAKAFIKL